MLVDNTTGNDRFIDCSKYRKIRNDDDRTGFSIPANAVDHELPDSLRGTDSFNKLVEDGVIVVKSFGDSFDSPVTQNEFNEIADGLFSGTFVGTPFAGATSPFTSSTLLSGATENYNFAGQKFLNIGIDDNGGGFKFKKQLQLPENIFSATAVVDFLNNDPWFSLYADAAVEVVGPPDKVRITAKSLGTSSLIAILPLENGVSETLNANNVLQFPTTAAPGTGTASVVEFLAKGPTGAPKSNVEITLSIFDSAVGGSLVAGAQFQVPDNGRVDSGLYTNQMVVKTDAEGLIKFEMAHNVATTVHIEAAKNPDAFLAVSPAAREAIVIS